MELFLVVEWVSGSPCLDGAKYYETKAEAAAVCLYFEKMRKKTGLQNVEYTICRTSKGNVSNLEIMSKEQLMSNFKQNATEFIRLSALAKGYKEKQNLTDAELLEYQGVLIKLNLNHEEGKLINATLSRLLN